MKVNKAKLEIAQARKLMNDTELANKSGLCLATIRSLGKYNTKPQTLGLIAKALNVDVSELLEDST